MEIALPGIIRHLLGLEIVSSEEVPDEIQHTKERKPDLLKKVVDTNGRSYILHIEYQAKSDKDMVYRMAEYSIMLQWKHRTDIKQYVVYIGTGRPKMAESIEKEDFYFRYHLLSLSSVDYKIFLSANQPEEKLLAVLADFKNDDPVKALKKILIEVRSIAQSDLAEDRYFNQLRILVQLRNLETQFDEAMETVTKFFKEEKDPLYKRGEAKGKEEGEYLKALAIAKELKNEGLANDFIAKTTRLTIKEVEKL
ncbi:hypothetical protein [Mucilaginibacter rubeus]|nr:hypothetical protein [Mucilaginibacter rubeus]